MPCYYRDASGGPCSNPGPHYEVVHMDGGNMQIVMVCMEHYKSFLTQEALNAPPAIRDAGAFVEAHFGARYRDCTFGDFVTSGPELEAMKPYMQDVSPKALRSLAGAKAASLAFCDSVIETGQGMLALCGREGNGKTMLAACIARRLTEAGKKIVVRQATAFAIDIRSTYRSGGVDAQKSSLNQILDPILRADVVMIEDLQPICFRGDIHFLMHEIIDRIYSEKKAFVLTSNIGLHDLRKPEALGAHLVSRMEESPSWLVELTATSWRSAVKRKEMDSPLRK
jgi:DNA replication protein DnaC